MSHHPPPLHRRYAITGLSGVAAALLLLPGAMFLLPRTRLVAVLAILAAAWLLGVAILLLLNDFARTRAHIGMLNTAVNTALTDPVTGLPSRRVAEDLISSSDPTLALTTAVIDVNGMRSFNEAFGRSSGDLYLHAIADRLRTIAGDGLAVRLRDDEFAIISDRDPASLAQALTETLRAPANIDGRLRSILVNIGLCQMDGANPSQLLGYAYLAMVTARRHGLGVQSYDPMRGSIPLLPPGTMPYTHADEPLRVTQNNPAPPSGVLACPRCGATALATIEQIPGMCYGVITRDDAGAVSIACGDETDVDWDGQTSIGVQCEQCPWVYRGDDWAAQLAASHTGDTTEASTDGER